MQKTMTADLEKLAQKARERGRPFRVLIVDDETWVRDVFRDFCNITNVFEIDLAGSGSEAIAKANQTVYDLITMDLIMPEMSGLDALIEIKQNSPRVPVMIVTGNATDRLVREAGVQGASRVLYKPIMLEEFIAEVATALA
jgi:two-component system chemotaxis response regulator CheY